MCSIVEFGTVAYCHKYSHAMPDRVGIPLDVRGDMSLGVDKGRSQDVSDSRYSL